MTGSLDRGRCAGCHATECTCPTPSETRQKITVIASSSSPSFYSALGHCAGACSFPIPIMLEEYSADRCSGSSPSHISKPQMSGLCSPDCMDGGTLARISPVPGLHRGRWMCFSSHSLNILQKLCEHLPFFLKQPLSYTSYTFHFGSQAHIELPKLSPGTIVAPLLRQQLSQDAVGLPQRLVASSSALEL